MLLAHVDNQIKSDTDNIHNQNDQEQQKQEVEGFCYLSCIYTNADCILGKFSVFKDKILKERPHVFSIVETALQSNPLSTGYCPDDFLLIDGYQMIRQDNEKERKGGILIYIRDDIEVAENKVLNQLSADIKECRWLELNQCGNKLIFCTVYRKGRSGPINNKLLNECITKACNLYGKILICGDLNFPEINWKNFEINAGPYSAPAQFLNCINNNYLIQYVSKATRVRGKDKPSLIDLIITEDSQTLQSEVLHDAPFEKGDHCILKWKYLMGMATTTEAEELEPVTKLNVNKGDYEKLNILLKDIDWDKQFEGKPLSECLSIFYQLTAENIDKCVPKKKPNKSKRGGSPPWMDKKARKQIKQKNCAWKRYMTSRTYSKYLDYVRCRNQTTKKLRKLKQEFEKKLAAESKSNPKAFYRYANFKSKSQKNVIRLRNANGKISMSNKENATILNNFFASVFTQEDDAKELIFNSSAENMWGSKPEDPFDFKGATIESENALDTITINEETVEKYLRLVDPTKSTTPDCIHPRIIKECAPGLTYPLTLIYQMSLRTGTVPSQWKHGNITPIHKGESRHDSCNYRPITITSLLCRTLEKIIKDAVIKHLDDNEYITDAQHGFRSKRSCLTNLLMNLEEITAQLDHGHSVDQIYLDFKKAFDKVPHQRLIYKLQKAGISGHVLNWIESFLSNRKQRVNINGTYSNWKNVDSGVPQGSVLGPVLFILFINDVPNILKSCACSIFADDTKLKSTANTVDEADKMQEDLNEMFQWCKEWKLEFNAKKCHVLHFGRKNVNHLYHINGTLISPVEYEKDLGVVITKDLKSENHISQCVKTANKILGMIKRTFSFMNKDMLVQLIKTFIRPHLEYGQQASSPYLKKDIKQLEDVQRRATKLLHHIEHLSYDERLKYLNLYSIEDRLKRGDMIFMYRLMTNDVNIDKRKLFIVKETKTRGHHLKVYFGPTSRLDIRHKFFSQRVIEPWNKLPANIVNSKTVDMFKINYDKWYGLVV